MSVSPPNDPRRQPDSVRPGSEPTPPSQPPVLPPEVTADPAGPVTPAAVLPEPRSYIAGIATAGLAAVCGAIFTSWLGAQGTLAGAMIGATIGSSVSEIVRAPLTSLERRLLQVGISARQLRRDGLLTTILTSPAAAQQALGMVSQRAILTVGVVAVVGFGLAMGGVTAVEVARGEPLASIVSDDQTTGTTVGQVLPNPPAVLAPATLPPTITAARAAGNSGGLESDILLPSARSRGGQPGLALSPVPGRTDNANRAPDAAGSPVTTAASPETAVAIIDSPMPNPTLGTTTPGTLTPTSNAQASAQPSQTPQPTTAAAFTSATTAAGTSTPTITITTGPTRVATSGTPSSTASALTPGTVTTAATSAPPAAPTSASTGATSSAAPLAGTPTPNITPTSTQTSVSGGTPTPSRTPTATPTPVPGAATPAAPPATLPAAPQT